MISTVLSASSAEVNMKTSVRSRRRSSPGNLRSPTLKWFDVGCSCRWVVVRCQLRSAPVPAPCQNRQPALSGLQV